MVKVNSYVNAFAEVYEILKYLNKDDYKKIDVKLLEIIKDNKNEDYIYVIDKEKNLKEQVMLPETRAILFNIFRDYLSTQEQKEKIKKWQADDLKKIDVEKRQQYNVNVFDKKQKESKLSDSNIDKKQLIEIKKKTVWQRIVDKIIKFFSYKK